MGVIRRIGRLVVDGLKSANQEATHPGRPPSYVATRSRFWKEPAEKAEQTREAARRMAEEQEEGGARPAPKAAARPPKAPEPAPKAPEPPANLRGEEEEVPWYLEGQEDVDGWDRTNGRDDD